MPALPKAPSSPLQGELIAEDRLCGTCNYNLKGLRTSQRCPECGTVIKGRRRTRNADVFTDAPLGYLRTLRLGALLMAGGSLAAAALTFATYGTANVLIALAGVLAAAAWWVGVWIVTGPERHNATVAVPPIDTSRILRIINRTLQCVWVISLTFLLAAAVSKLSAMQARAATAGSLTTGNAFFTFASIAARLETIHAVTLPICLLTLVPVALHVGRLAEWAEDDDLKNRMVLVAWGIGLGAPLGGYGSLLASILPSGLALFFSVGRAFGILMLLVSWLAFLWGMLSLASMCAWAVSNAETTLETEARLARKLAKHYQDIAPNVEALNRPAERIKAQSLPGERRIEQTDQAPIPLAEPEGPPKKIKQG